MNVFFLNSTRSYRTLSIILNKHNRAIPYSLFNNNTKHCYCSTIVDKLQDKDVIEKLTNAKEDIASFVRFNRQFQVIDHEQFKEFYSEEQNPDKSKFELIELQLKIKQICAEYEYLCQVNKRVPSVLSTKEMNFLLRLDGPERRQIYLLRSYFRNTVKIRQKVKKIVNHNLKGENNLPKAEFEVGCFDKNGELQYGLWKNGLFLRLNSQSSRIRIQSALNSSLYGPNLAFDWKFPNTEFNDLFNNPATSEILIKKLALDIFKICNYNYKKISSTCNPTFNIVHLNLDKQSLIFKYLKEKFELSIFDSKFFNYSSNSYIEDYNDKNIIYISPHCKQTISDEEIQMHEMNELLFVVCPYSELLGLKRNICKEIFFIRQAEEIKHGIQFRRLPTHNSVNPNNHVVLSHFIKCLRDVVIDCKSWNQALVANVPAKYHKNL